MSAEDFYRLTPDKPADEPSAAILEPESRPIVSCHAGERAFIPGFDATAEQLAEIEKSVLFHGNVSQDYVEEQLTEVGDCLLRVFGTGKGLQLSMIVMASQTRGPGQYQNIPMSSRRQPKDGKTVFFLTGEHYPDPLTCYKEYVARQHLLTRDGGGLRSKRAIPRQPWEIRRDDLVLENKIGEGAFGVVMSGRMKQMEAAIKVMKINEKTKGKVGLMRQEAAFMKVYQHRNIVRFYGALITDVEAYIVMELVKGGGLNKYLRGHPELDTLTRRSFCYDVAAGLAFLHRRGCMHRDVGARNCLVEQETKIVKLADFGLSCRGTEVKLGADEQVAIRWAAPEVTHEKIYTSGSDVWGFAMVCWEIMNDGKEPFEGKTNAQIKEGVVSSSSFRPPLDSSSHWNDALKRIVKMCWHSKWIRRPNMDLICAKLHEGCQHLIGEESKKIMQEVNKKADTPESTTRTDRKEDRSQERTLDRSGEEARTRRQSRKAAKEQQQVSKTTAKKGKKKRTAVNKGSEGRSNE